jgi:hypothetical protein
VNPGGTVGVPFRTVSKEIVFGEKRGAAVGGNGGNAAVERLAATASEPRS